MTPPFCRTLEFLMRHLVHMASFSAQTNMHARNLAIVWAPNLLRWVRVWVSWWSLAPGELLEDGVWLCGTGEGSHPVRTGRLRITQCGLELTYASPFSELE